MASVPILTDESIRRHYDETSKTWYFSVVDTIAVATDTYDARNYWKVLKSRLYKAHPQLVTNCNQLKMKARDGKSYLTDTADSETLLQIISAISKDATTPLRLYFEKIEVSYPHITEASLQDRTLSEVVEVAVDVYQTPREVVVKSFVAGCPLEDIFISVTYKTVTLRGRRLLSQPSAKYLTQEIYWGTFSRTIELPREVHIDTVEATVTHGLLTITLLNIDTDRTRIVKVKLI